MDDIKLPGIVHLAILRSPHAHARIRSVDVSQALQAEGVKTAVTAETLGSKNQPLPLYVPHPELKAKTAYPLASEKARYVGEPVAAVLATSRALAEDARELIRVDYETLSPVVDTARALLPDAPRVHDELGDNLAAQVFQKVGDYEAARQKADHLFKERLSIKRGGGHSMECRVVMAQYDPRSEILSVWASTQVPHLFRRALGDLLSLEESRIHVIAPDVGGGFGPKAIFYSEDFLVAYLAIELGVPVKWTEDRLENFVSSVHEREQFHEVELAVRKDGTFLGLRDRFIADSGAYAPWGIIVPLITSATIVGPYKIPNFEVSYQVVYTNKVPVAVVRGAGRPQAVFVMERMVERVARELRLDPAEVRRRNFIQPEEFPYNVGITYRDGSSLTYDSGNYPACLGKALEMIDYERLKVSLAEQRARGKCVGVGMAYYVEGSGLGPYEGAVVRVDPSGKVVVCTGASSQGQSHETTLAQICADELGVSMDDVRVITGDTSSIAFGIGTFASRIGVVAGAAVTLAARAVREKALKIGAVLLEANPEDLELGEGTISAKGSPRRRVSLARVALVASGSFPGSTMPKGIEPGLQETRYFTPPQATYTNGAHVVVVEGDPELAQVRILRYVVAHDCGTMINPMVVEGQIRGGVAHGIGDSLYEELVYDDTGQLLTGSYMDYLLPTASEVPRIEVAHLETPSPFVPGGMKGAGEGGTIPVAAAIAAAIEDAFSNYGVRITELPINPEKLWRLIKGNRTGLH